jgi:uncharacterized protein YybS (DUF2232 family)
MTPVQPPSQLVQAMHVVRASLATTVLFLAGFVLPFGGPLLMMLTPQPALRLCDRSGRSASLAACGFALAAIALTGGGGAAALYLVSFGLLTVVLPLLLDREGSSIELTLGLATVVVAVTVLVTVVAIDSPSEVLIALRASLEQVRADAVAVYTRAGLSADVIRELEEGSRGLVDVMLRLAPALFLLMIGGMVLVNVDLLRRAQRAAGDVPVFGDLTRWKCPPELVWLLILGGYATFLTDGLSAQIAANAFAVLLAVYFCQGLVIAQFYMRRWHSPFWVNGLVYVCIIVEWLLATLVMLLGVFDLWADFRRLNPRPAGDD